jgi:hypothetical protein
VKGRNWRIHGGTVVDMPPILRQVELLPNVAKFHVIQQVSDGRNARRIGKPHRTSAYRHLLAGVVVILNSEADLL